MIHSTRHPLPCLAIAVLAVASPLLADGGVEKLAPVVDLNPRHTEAASASLQEPMTLIIVAEAVPLNPPATTSNKSAASPKSRALKSAKRQQAHPPIRAAEAFDPTAVPRSDRHSNHKTAETSSRKLAPVIRVYEPIRPRQQPWTGAEIVTPRQIASRPKPAATPQRILGVQRILEVVNRQVFLATRSGRLERAAAPPGRSTRADARLSARLLAAFDSYTQPPAAPKIGEQSVTVSTTTVRPTEPSAPRLSGFLQVIEVVDDSLRNQIAPAISTEAESVPAVAKRSVIQFADSQPLLAVLQQSTSASNLPSPAEERELTQEQRAEAEEVEVEAFDLDLKPMHSLSARTMPKAGEFPTNYAEERFAREGTIAHRMGFSRAHMETAMMWEAPASSHRPLYFEEINLERHGHKIPLVQPAISAAHFFGRVPLLPYMMVSEKHRDTQYALGHYRPGDYAPYSLYVPRLRLDASAAESAIVAAVIFAFP